MSLILRPYKFFKSVFGVDHSITSTFSLPVKSSFKLLRFTAVFLFLSLAAQAQTWLPATGGNWTVGANWSGGVPPVAGGAVVINSDQSADITNIPTISLSSLTISGNCTLAAAASGNTITVTSSFNVSAGKTLTIGNAGFRLNFTLSNTGTGTISGTAILNAGATPRLFQNDGILIIPVGGLLTGVGPSDFTLSSGATLSIGSTSGITATGGATGSVQVTGTRTYSTGANYHYIGNANQGVGNGLPATVASLTINNTGGGGNNTVTLASGIAITNALTVTNGVFALGANNVTSVGSVNMTGTSITGTGTLTLAGDVTTNASGSTAGISAPIALGGANRTFTIGEGGASPDLQISAPISGAVGIIKSGLGLMNLFGANTFSGLTFVNAGTLLIGSLSALGSTVSGTIISSGAVLNLAGIVHTATEALTINGTGIASGGSIVNTSASSAAYAGLITLGSSSSINANAGTINISNIGTITGAGFDLTLGGSTGGTISSIIGTGSGQVVKNGSGIWTLAGSNTFTGGVTLDAGTLRLGNTGALNSGAPNAVNFGAGSSGILQLNGNSVTVSGLITNAVLGTPVIETNAAGIATLTINTTGTNTFAGTLQNGGSGTLAITKSGIGSLSLSGNNTYSGVTTLSAGTLNINSNTALGTGTFVINGGSIDNTSGSFKALSNNNLQNWNSDFTFLGTESLNLGTGAVTPSASRQITVNGNTLTVGGSIGGGAISITKLGAGALTLSGANTFTGGTTLSVGTLNINNSSALGSVTGTFTINGGVIDNTTGGLITTLDYPQNWNGDFTFNGTQNLNLGTGNVSLSGNRQITVNSNTLTVGGVISAAALNLTKAGAGILSFGSNAVTLNSLAINAGTLTSTSGTLTLSGNFTNSGTFNNNGGTVHYNGGASQTVASVTYNNLILSGAGQKNGGGAITVNGNLTNSSIFDLGANTLSVTGTIDNTGGNIRFTGPTNGIATSTGTVTYYGASQTIAAGTYNDLVINQSAGQATLGGPVTVNGVLTLTNGNLNLNGFDVTLGPSATISVASPSATRMIIATGGSQVIKTFSGIGSFLFPIGDNTGTLEYSPVTVNVTSASGFPGNVGVTIVDAKHPDNSSTTNYLTRYWNLATTLTTAAVTVTAQYPSSDITGAEASIKAAQLNGTFNQLTNPWIKFGTLAANTLTATGTLTSVQVSAFSGITGADPVVNITGGDITVCSAIATPLNAGITGGDGPFVYDWTPITGLSASSIANPIATPLVSTVYTVMLGMAMEFLPQTIPQ